jgi:hypothetical protein
MDRMVGANENAGEVSGELLVLVSSWSSLYERLYHHPYEAMNRDLIWG